MEARVAVLEQIARATQVVMERISSDMSSMRAESRTGLDSARDRQDRDFRLLFGASIAAVLGLAGLMAKGFHWF